MTEKSNGFAWPNEARIAVAVTCLLRPREWPSDLVLSEGDTPRSDAAQLPTYGESQ
jgi:hypothetical protein